MRRLTLWTLFATLFTFSGVRPGASQGMGKLIALRPAGSAGIFDPSLADTPPGQRAWMSFSAVDPSPRWPTKNTRVITTRLAYSDDRGASWTDLGQVNGLSEMATGSDAQTWNNEVSSLVYDPYAPEAERWKLFWHHFAIVNDKRVFKDGWIGYKAASTPPGLRDAVESKLFVGRAYNTDNNSRFGATGSPLAGTPLLRLNDLSKDLNFCVVPTEPSAIATASGLYLSLSCFELKGFPPLAMLTGGPEPIVALLKCDAPCHPTQPGAWRYVSTLLTSDDARASGADKYNAPNLFAQGDKFYVAASPVTNKPVNNAYNGCHIFGFTDLAHGQLESDGAHPRILRRIAGDPGTFNGACTYAQAVTASGFLYGQIIMRPGRPYFQIFQTGLTM